MILLWLAVGIAALTAVGLGASACEAANDEEKARLWTGAGLSGLFAAALSLIGVWLSAPGGGTPEEAPSRLSVHPVFHTAITGDSAKRPAVQVDVLNASESWFGDAELYLAVQSSRFPNSAWILLPINVGDFDGCRARFVQLPFEVSPGDNLLFNLLDDDELTEEEERRIVTGCGAAGYGVLIGSSFYAPMTARIVAPVADDAAGALGEVVVAALTMAKFDNYGRAAYIVPDRFPAQPNNANRLTLLDDSEYARVQLRIYGPQTPLDAVDLAPQVY